MRNSYFPSLQITFQVRAALFNLFSEDLILANRELTMFSVDPADQRTDDNETEFELYSDRMLRIADDMIEVKGQAGKLYPGPKAKIVNLK